MGSEQQITTQKQRLPPRQIVKELTQNVNNAVPSNKTEKRNAPSLEWSGRETSVTSITERKKTRDGTLALKPMAYRECGD